MYTGKVIPDWGIFEKMGGLKNPKACHMLGGALQAFLREPTQPVYKAVAQAFAKTGSMQEAIARVQAYGTSADFPATVLEVLAKFQPVSYFDTAYEEVFDMIDMRSSNRNGFDILDVEGALSFALVEEGAKAKLYGMSGAKVTVTLDMYGAGLSWSRRLFDDREYWTLENNAIEFRNQWFYTKAVNFYALIDALPAGVNLAWSAVTPAGVPNTNENYDAIRDINTINQACENVLLATRNKGYGVSPASPFIILAPIQLVGRLSMALGLVHQPFATSVPRMVYNVTPRYSLMLAASDVYYVILPKIKTKGADRMDLTIFTKFDELSYSDHSVGWGRYGGAIGDTDQFQRCSTS